MEGGKRAVFCSTRIKVYAGKWVTICERKTDHDKLRVGRQF